MSNCVYRSVDMMNTGDFVRKESCMKEYINSDNGKVSIDESVVAQVAGLTALDCFGIVGMGIVSVKDGIVKQLRRDNVSKGVNVRFDENGDIVIELHIVVAYGVSRQSYAVGKVQGRGFYVV